jgi:ubiquinone/menaquinone biosynthesis C-methylase UbiE
LRSVTRTPAFFESRSLDRTRPVFADAGVTIASLRRAPARPTQDWKGARGRLNDARLTGYGARVAATEVNNPIFARLFDRLAAKDKGRGEDALRREMLAGLSGRVIEVGPGNGINFEHVPETVEDLIAVEPEPYLRGVAKRTADGLPLTIHVVDGSAEDLPVADGSIDAVFVAGVLCSVHDQDAALREFRRVLRPGGELRFYEHVRSRRRGFARYQDAVALVWPHLMGGCKPNLDTLAAIERAGFRLERCRGFGFPNHARAYPITPRILGVARA